MKYFLNTKEDKVLTIENDGSIEIFNFYAEDEIEEEDKIAGGGQEIVVAPVVAKEKKQKIKVSALTPSAPQSEKKSKAGNRFEEIVADINAGMSSQDIAQKHGTSLATVHVTKSIAKKKGLINISVTIKSEKKPKKEKAPVDKRTELINAYGRTVVERVEDMLSMGEDVQTIAEDLDVQLTKYHVETIRDRLDL